MEWVTLITLITPNILVGRAWTRSRPALAISLWFSLLFSAVLSSVIALISAVFTIFNTWFTLETQDFGSHDWLWTVLFSFVPWLFLAMAGITLALMGQIIEPHIESAKLQQTQIDTALSVTSRFHGLGVCEVAIPIPIAFVSRANRRPVIVLSEVNRTLLSPREHEAVLWHELGHVRWKHSALKRIGNFLLLITPWLAVTRHLVYELDTLSEIQADHFATKHVDGVHLESARRKFTF
jgi:Zn-dependent protease with chaperone function